MFLESDVTKCNAKGNVGIICMGGDHNYYLAKLITNIHETEESGKDDNNYEMPAHQKVITCSYLITFKIWVLSMLVKKCRDNFTIFQFASAIHQQERIAEDSAETFVY